MVLSMNLVPLLDEEKEVMEYLELCAKVDDEKGRIASTLCNAVALRMVSPSWVAETLGAFYPGGLRFDEQDDPQYWANMETQAMPQNDEDEISTRIIPVKEADDNG